MAETMDKQSDDDHQDGKSREPNRPGFLLIFLPFLLERSHPLAEHLQLANQRTPLMKKMLTLFFVPCALLVSACSTPSLGRMQPYLGEPFSCDELATEMERTNRFCTYARENSDYDKGSDVASRLLLRVSTQVDEVTELHDAWKSAIVRRHQLEQVFEEQSCSIERPDWTCPKPCGRNRFFRWLDADPESCVAFSDKESRKFGFTECTNNRGQPVACPD